MEILMASDTITLGGGCFWCVEAVLSRLTGVTDIQSGYAGGHATSPSYREVCTGQTGHAEVVRVTFDPELLPLDTLLEIFFAFHDPTTLNRQGPDTGTQYRSIVLAESDAQESATRRMIEQLESEDTFGAPIVTEVTRLEEFWPAEAEHKDYYSLHPGQAYCQAVIAPKVAKLRSSFADRLAS